jgi:hypothetical protein
LKKLENVDFGSARKSAAPRSKSKFKKSEAEKLLNTIGRRQYKLIEELKALKS